MEAVLVAPAKTPKEIISQFAGWFSAAMQIPEVKAKLIAQGLYPVGLCGADFAAHIRKQYDDYGPRHSRGEHQGRINRAPAMFN